MTTQLVYMKNEIGRKILREKLARLCFGEGVCALWVNLERCAEKTFKAFGNCEKLIVDCDVSPNVLSQCTSCTGGKMLFSICNYNIY